MTDEELLEQQLKEMRLVEFQNGFLTTTEDNSKDDLFKLMLKRAKYIALGALYPFEYEIDELPQRLKEDWQVRCACELFEKIDKADVQSYSENNLSISFFTGLLSSDLKNELTPKAGVPK